MVGKLEAWYPDKEAANIPAAWREAKNLRKLSAEEYLEALAASMARNREETLYLRLQAWWAFNHPIRKLPYDPTQTVPSPFLPNSKAQDNLEHLASLLKHDEPHERLLKAEVLRELGRFQEALDTLHPDQPFSHQKGDGSSWRYIGPSKKLLIPVPHQSHAEVAHWLRALIQDRDTRVRKMLRRPKKFVEATQTCQRITDIPRAECHAIIAFSTTAPISPAGPSAHHLVIGKVSHAVMDISRHSKSREHTRSN